MKVLIISQVYWPDTASVSQHVTDLAETIAKDKMNSCTVVTSRNNYENPNIRYSARENVNNVSVLRLNNAGFGKKWIIGRLTDFISFNVLVFLKLFFVSKKDYDVIIGLTSPPLVSFFGSLFARIKKIKFCYWVMDLQPELSISAGYLKKDSIVARAFEFMGDSIFKRSDLIIALDRYMKRHIESRKSTDSRKIEIIPVWPVVLSEYTGERLSNPFRVRNGFGDKIVIMYSGNHSVVHPLNTLLETAKELSNDERFLFVFVGEGVRKKDVSEYKNEFGLNNILQLPYQKRSEIHLSLSSADIQVVILGNNQVGFTHPNKIYGAMHVGKPILYIGPNKSHITDILNKLDGNIMVEHGQKDLLISKLIHFGEHSSKNIEEICQLNKNFAITHFSTTILKEKTVHSIKNLLRGA